jgi:hypothetical protein
VTSLICKHILGETSDKENRFLQNWLAKSTVNHRRYREIKLILDNATNLKCVHFFDTNVAWAKMSTKAEKRGGVHAGNTS